MDFRFRAPSLFDPAATAAGSGTEYHDAPGAGEQLARLKPCADWLADQLRARSFDLDGPDTDEGGWMMSVPGGDGGFALIILDAGTAEGQHFLLIVTPIGPSEREAAKVDQALQDLLETSPLISDLAVEE